MSLSLISIFTIIALLYCSIVSILSIFCVFDSCIMIFFSLLSILIYSVSILGIVSLEIEWEDKFFKVVKTFDEKYFPGFFGEANAVSFITLIVNIVIQGFIGLYTFENFDQIVEPYMYETMVYIVFSTLPFYGCMIVVMIMVLLFFCFIPCAIIFIIVVFLKFVIIDTFLACRKAYREVYRDNESLNKTKDGHKTVKSE